MSVSTDQVLLIIGNPSKCGSDYGKRLGIALESLLHAGARLFQKKPGFSLAITGFSGNDPLAFPNYADAADSAESAGCDATGQSTRACRTYR